MYDDLEIIRRCCCLVTYKRYIERQEVWEQF